MKCYICLTDSIVNRKDYFNMLKVTLISARKNTSLRLIAYMMVKLAILFTTY